MLQLSLIIPCVFPQHFSHLLLRKQDASSLHSPRSPPPLQHMLSFTKLQQQKRGHFILFLISTISEHFPVSNRLEIYLCSEAGKGFTSQKLVWERIGEQYDNTAKLL